MRFSQFISMLDESLVAPEVESFVAGIFQNWPDPPRLMVFADWLEENGHDDLAIMMRLAGQLLVSPDPCPLVRRVNPRRFQPAIEAAALALGVARVEPMSSAQFMTMTRHPDRYDFDADSSYYGASHHPDRDQNWIGQFRARARGGTVSGGELRFSRASYQGYNSDGATLPLEDVPANHRFIALCHWAMHVVHEAWAKCRYPASDPRHAMSPIIVAYIRNEGWQVAADNHDFRNHPWYADPEALVIQTGHLEKTHRHFSVNNTEFKIPNQQFVAALPQRLRNWRPLRDSWGGTVHLRRSDVSSTNARDYLRRLYRHNDVDPAHQLFTDMPREQQNDLIYAELEGD